MFLYDALRIFENLNVDYGNKTKEEMDELDNAIDEIRYAAECWERLTGGIKFKDYIARLNCEKIEEKIKAESEKEIIKDSVATAVKDSSKTQEKASAKETPKDKKAEAKKRK